MEDIKKYRRYTLLALFISYISFLGHISNSLTDNNRSIFKYIFWISILICIGFCTAGVVKFSNYIGKRAYFLTLISVIGIMGYFFETMYDSTEIIKVISLLIVYFGMFLSIGAGIFAIVKDERGMAKLSGFFMLFFFGMLFVSLFIVYHLNGF